MNSRPRASLARSVSESLSPLENNPFRKLQLTQRIVPLDRSIDRAMILARAFCSAHAPDQVFAALRMARLWTVDATRALDTSCFDSFIACRDLGMTNDEFETLAELAHVFRDALEF